MGDGRWKMGDRIWEIGKRCKAKGEKSIVNTDRQREPETIF